MPVPPFVYQDPFPLGADETEYRLLSKEGVSTTTFEGRDILKVEPEALAFLAQQAMRDCSFLLRTRHLQQVAAILDDPEASTNDRYVALTLLKNAEIAAEGILPFCQDTGDGDRHGQEGPAGLDGRERRRGDLARHLRVLHQGEPPLFADRAARPLAGNQHWHQSARQIDLYATEGAKYEFLFVAKGGGSANKTFLFQETKALLNPKSFEKFVTDKLSYLGTAACPPYHLVFVIGGTSAEACLKTVKIASTKYLDALPTTGNAHGRAFRDPAMEQKILAIAQQSGIGAQFGENISPSMCASSGCRAMAPAVPWDSACRAPPTATSRRRSRRTGSSWKSLKRIPVSSSRLRNGPSRTTTSSNSTSTARWPRSGPSSQNIRSPRGSP